MHDVFLSDSNKDSRIATTILSIRVQNGIKCRIDYRDAAPGENYAGTIVGLVSV